MSFRVRTVRARLRSVVNSLKRSRAVFFFFFDKLDLITWLREPIGRSLISPKLPML
jgi:hypothetical protein